MIDSLDEPVLDATESDAAPQQDVLVTRNGATTTRHYPDGSVGIVTHANEEAAIEYAGS